MIHLSQSRFPPRLRAQARGASEMRRNEGSVAADCSWLVIFIDQTWVPTLLICLSGRHIPRAIESSNLPKLGKTVPS